MAILFDTQAAIWATQKKLPNSVAHEVDAAASTQNLLLSPVTAWEIATLVRRGRLEFSDGATAFIRMLYAAPGVSTAALTHEVARLAGELDMAHGDPADRILVASAIEYEATLLTSDRKILEFAAKSKLLECLEC